MSDWNIDMVQSPDVLEDVKACYARLAELPSIREKAGATWSSLYDSMAQAFGEFAGQVADFGK